MNRKIWAILASMIGIVTHSANAKETQTPKTAIEIGERWELFIDPWLLEKQAGTRLKMHPPERREVVLTTDMPWEGPSSAYFTAIQDGSKVRLYYRGFCPSDLDVRQVTCMAESADGIHFTRPELGLFPFNGSKANNIVWQGIESHNFAPFLDANPNAKPDERYKALGGVQSKLYAFGSPDGVHWKKLQATPVITAGEFDSLNIAFWDATIGRYRCYSRYYDPRGARSIQSCLSADFLHWEKPKPNQYPTDAPLQHLYTNATRPIPDASHILLSFPKRFFPERKKFDDYKEMGVSDAALLSSRDGTHWERTFLEAWARPGRDPKNWTQRSNMPASGILQLAPDEFTMYLSEHYEWPDNRLRRVVVRKHGFASLSAGASLGEAISRPIVLRGKTLLLNYATSAGGAISVEALDESGKPIPGFSASDMTPLYGDEMEAPIRWKGGDLGTLLGKTIRLRFLLQDADIYALRFRNAP